VTILFSFSLITQGDILGGKKQFSINWKWTTMSTIIWNTFPTL